MRGLALLVAAGILSVVFVAAVLPSASAQGPTLPRLFVHVDGESEGADHVFTPDVILIPQVPIVLNVTFRNNETTAIPHSFTINDVNDTGAIVPSGAPIDSGIIGANETVTLEFTIMTLDRIEFGALSFQPERGDRGILFYCIPHRGAGMIGEIVLASLAEPEPEKGILLRAYWIGLIGIFAMVLWIGISYFVIKSSSPRFTDHKDHLRKGLP